MVAVYALFAAFNAFVVVCHAEVKTSADSEGYQELFLGDTVYLECNGTSGNEKVKKWLKDGIEITEKSHNNIKVISDTNQLQISKAKRGDDEGNYTCDFGSSSQAVIRLIAKPLIDKLMPVGHTKDGKSVNIGDGSTLTLECVANSSVPLQFEWFAYRDTDESKRHFKPRGNTSEADNRSLLIIESTTLEDRAFYGCKVSNKVGEASAEILVRVKDKWMALWPFLGIVGEVIILCTIIFIYEKRRQKPDFDDSSNDNANENKSPVASGTSKGQEIRQRK